MSKSLAILYRPTTWDDVVEQEVIVTILKSQVEEGTFKHAYLFTGPAGCGKTTCARIFSRAINNGAGNPIEMDAASNNSVDNVRELIQQAKLRSLDSEYKVFILDECHALSNSAWQAMLKIIEEPPEKSVFIFCTTDPQKIPATIISRVQRYDFQRISQRGISDRLIAIMAHENMSGAGIIMENDAVEYIVKLANGGMRDAITLMDKCLSYSNRLTLENVLSALGVSDYDVMFELIWGIVNTDAPSAVKIIENLHENGKDLKQFVKMFIQFLLDITKYGAGCSEQYLNIPLTAEYMEHIKNLNTSHFYELISVLNDFVKLNSEIKYSASPKYDIEATIMLECYKSQEN